jgi:hypothetical protein
VPERHVHFLGDRDPSLTDTLNDDTGAALNLTGGTVRFKMRAFGSSTLKVDAAATIVSASAGTVRYDWAALDVDTEGFFIGWWEVTLAGRVQVEREFLLEFRSHGQIAGWLVELEEVRDAMELREDATELDDQIRALIPKLSQRIMYEIEREVAPPSTAVQRTFSMCGRILDVSPYDLRSVSSLVVDPARTARVMTANLDYKLLPVGGDRWGVYTEIEFGRHVDLSAYTYTFAEVDVQITGNWGFASIPQIAKDACIDAIKARLRISSARGSYVDSEMEGQPSVGPMYGLPPSTRNILRPLYRNAS